MIHRRSFLTGLAATLAAPAIVRAASLMPVRGIVMDVQQPIAHLNGVPLYADLVDITRQAFVPRLFVQLNMSTPLAGFLQDMDRLDNRNLS
jgi:hypothetical protein